MLKYPFFPELDITRTNIYFAEIVFSRIVLPLLTLIPARVLCIVLLAINSQKLA